MANSITELIIKIRPKIAGFRAKGINEAQTKEWLVKPFFEALDWDFSDPDEVVPEDDDSTGKRPDYGFYIDGKPKLLVEAKTVTNSLDDNRMISDKLNYCANAQIPFLIITNGERYKIYYSELKGSGKDKLLQEFSISDDFDEEIVEMLRKSSFERDRLLNYAKSIFILTNIKKAVENIFQSPSKRIIELINDNVREFLGHKFGNDEIELALKQFTMNISADIYEPETPGVHPPEIPSVDGKGQKWSVENQFKNGKWLSSSELYKKLISQLRKSGINFEENPTKFYIGFVASECNFCQIHGQKSGLKIYINLELRDLSEQETLKVRDVSGIGHWGMGDLECFVSSEADLDWVASIIRKAYQKNITGQ